MYCREQRMIGNNIQVEIASRDESLQILEIQKAAFLGQAKIYDNYELPPLTENLESLEKEFSEKTFLKVLLKGKIIGAARYTVSDYNHVTIEKIVIKPEYQNQGFGTALLKEIESRVPRAIAFQLFTGNKSVRNIHLYEKLGYKIIKRQTTDKGIELLQMEKRP